MQGENLIPWPYPVHYGEQRSYETDVLVIGGGIAGVWAAIGAARQGAQVTLMEKASTRRSGAGGSGCDHWQWAADNPGSRLTPEELADALVANQGGYRNGISSYIQCASGYETLLEMEAMGGKVRDTGDEFKGADFRDEKTKLLYAYDYQARYCIRIWGHNYKPKLREAIRQLGVRVIDRCTGTALLTEGGAHGARVTGATGLDCHSGEFIVVRAKAVILSTNRPQRIWLFSSELRGSTTQRPGSDVGNGFAMAWRIGAEFTMMEKSAPLPFNNPFSYPIYGTGNALNTWYATTIVDANGKEVPWVDCNGREFTRHADRHLPAAGQKFFLMGGGCSSGPHPGLKQFQGPKLIPDLEARMRRGEFSPPFYADLPAMPEHERKVIWGLMVGEEGKTRTPILNTYNSAGFDPARDLLQTYDFLRGQGMREPLPPQERIFGEIGVAGGMLCDWDLMSNVPGLFGAGEHLFGVNDHANAACSGRYAGARAALYARERMHGQIDPGQLAREKRRIYAPLAGRPDSIDWKELNAGLARMMQNYCSDLKNEELLGLAENWMNDIEENEVPRAFADNPHKLMRTLDVIDLVTAAQMIVHASRARKASSEFLHFRRLDYPDMDPTAWNKFLVIARGASGVEVSDRPFGYWGDYEANYRPRNADNMRAMGRAAAA